MSDFHFGVNDYDLNYYPKEASDGMGGVDWDKVESVEIECADFIRKPDDKSCWFELFGTPEKAARTLAGIVTADGCVDCALLDATCCRNKDVWLEWLKEDN